MAQGKKKALTNKTEAVQKIIDTLSKAIAQHKLKPGQRLIEAQIVDALKVNRNHVQAALQRLSLLRIVTIEPNRGAFVSQPSAQEAKEIFAARRAIERGIVESITVDVVEKNTFKIEEHMKAEQVATAGNDRRVIVTTLSDYHRLLADICGNQVLQEIFNTLMVRSSLIVALYQRNDVPSCQHHEHQGVIDALRKGEQARAVDIMMEHLYHLESELVLENGQESDLDLLAALKELQ
ncbi:GntR family transcriptional regulator [Marinomonas sp.]|nr:GntR family transcriptional regulator [Marinomonas sp.]MDB4837693.1 GntR family transcriptional regulator [Marinomonas sp.]